MKISISVVQILSNVIRTPYGHVWEPILVQHFAVVFFYFFGLVRNWLIETENVWIEIENYHWLRSDILDSISINWIFVCYLYWFIWFLMEIVGSLIFPLFFISFSFEKHIVYTESNPSISTAVMNHHELGEFKRGERLRRMEWEKTDNYTNKTKKIWERMWTAFNAHYNAIKAVW